MTRPWPDPIKPLWPKVKHNLFFWLNILAFNTPPLTCDTHKILWRSSQNCGFQSKLKYWLKRPDFTLFHTIKKVMFWVPIMTNDVTYLGLYNIFQHFYAYLWPFEYTGNREIKGKQSRKHGVWNIGRHMDVIKSTSICGQIMTLRCPPPFENHYISLKYVYRGCM